MSELKAGSVILLVDDDKIFADVLASALSKRGFQTVVAHDLAAALALVTEWDVDCAVIDLKIERESGLELLPRLKALKPDIRMLILTGYSSIATAVAAIKLGAIDYACKPVNADEVVALLSGQKAAEPGQAPINEAPPSIKRLQWEHIQRILEENNGNISATARSLGMHRRTLQRMLQKRPVKR